MDVRGQQEHAQEHVGKPSIQRIGVSILLTLFLEALLAITLVLTLTTFPVTVVYAVNAAVVPETDLDFSRFGWFELYFRRFRVVQICAGYESSKCGEWFDKFSSFDDATYDALSDFASTKVVSIPIKKVHKSSQELMVIVLGYIIILACTLTGKLYCLSSRLTRFKRIGFWALIAIQIFLAALLGLVPVLLHRYTAITPVTLVHLVESSFFEDGERARGETKANAMIMYTATAVAGGQLILTAVIGILARHHLLHTISDDRKEYNQEAEENALLIASEKSPLLSS